MFYAVIDGNLQLMAAAWLLWGFVTFYGKCALCMHFDEIFSAKMIDNVNLICDILQCVLTYDATISLYYEINFSSVIYILLLLRCLCSRSQTQSNFSKASQSGRFSRVF